MITARALCVLAVLFLVGCGGLSEADLQATVGRSIEATEEAEQIAAAVQATQEAEEGCGEQALQEYGKTMERQMERFASQAELAGSTPRMSLGIPLQELLNVQNDTEDIEAPECVDWFHKTVIATMMAYRSGYTKFAAQADEIEVQAILMVATQQFNNLRNQLVELQEGRPVSTPTLLPTETPAPTKTPLPPTLTPHAPYTPAVPTAEHPEQIVFRSEEMMRSEPDIAFDYVIRKLCDGDTVAVLAKQQINDRTWGYVRVVSLGEDCGSDRVAVGEEGWIARIPLINAEREQ